VQILATVLGLGLVGIVDFPESRSLE